MGLWTLSGIIESLSRHRIPVTVMSATVMTDGQKTEAVALPPNIGGGAIVLAFETLFASTPSAVDYQLQTAMNNVDAEFFDIGSSMTDNGGGITVVTGVVARFARVIANDADTKAVTITILCQ